MSVALTTETVINIEWLRQATYADMKAVLNASSRHPEKVAALNELFATPEGMKIANEMINDPQYVPVSQRPVSAEEEAQRLADLDLAEKQEAEEQQRLADEAAAAGALSEPVVAPVVVPEPIAEKKKIVVDYQATAEDGTPIGRPTHIEGWTHEEVIDKIKNAHINAVRYAERVKRGRVKDIETTTQVQKLEEQAKVSQQEADVAVEVATKEKDPAKLQEAIRKSTKAERDNEEALAARRAAGQAIANAWLIEHKEDYLQCEANNNLISKWMADNGLTLTHENLEAAYVANETKLAKPQYRLSVEEPAAVVPNAQPAASVTPPAAASIIPVPVAPVVPEPVPATPPASQPAATAPAPAPAAAPNSAPAARRPGVNGGIAPGTLSAARPSGTPTPQPTSNEAFLKEVHAMPREEYREKLRTSKQFREQLKAAGVKIIGEDQYKTAR